MLKKWSIGILVLILGIGFTHAQTIKSEKSYIQINNKKEIVDKTPPEINIISPDINQESSYKSIDPDINLVAKATDQNGISSVIVNSKIVEISENGFFSFQIPLYVGSNEVSIIAIDNNDNHTEQKITIDYFPSQITLEEKVTRNSKYYGLIIGVNNYQDPKITSLNNPINDAQNIQDVLVENYTFDPENIIFLKDAKRSDIIQSLDLLAKKITSSDNLLIFYAGHGWWDQDANNGYWLPSDAKNDTKTEWFRNSTLVDYLKEIKSKHTLLITDACFGGAIFKTREAFADADKAVQKLYELPSRKAMTSGTLTEVPDQSAFIKYLVERLENNEEKYLSSEQLFSSFRLAVINNSDAVPQYGEIKNVGDEGGDFIFIKR